MSHLITILAKRDANAKLLFETKKRGRQDASTLTLK